MPLNLKRSWVKDTAKNRETRDYRIYFRINLKDFDFYIILLLFRGALVWDIPKSSSRDVYLERKVLIADWLMK